MRNVILVFSLLLAGTACYADDRPNFVIFVADDMAWEDCGAYGHPNIRTPNIDALAASGMRFDNAYLTCSSCSPSRCSIMTGRYPHSTGAAELHLPLPEDQTMMTAPLRSAGYWTAAVGKWHLGEAVATQVDYRAASPPNKMADAWTTALKNRPQDRPFFLWAAHSDPHRGYQKGAVDPPHTRNEVVVPPFLPDTPAVRDDLALYYDEISRFDQHIGRVLDELERQHVASNTFVLVISDNGRPFPHCKTRVHVPGVRTPFVVRWPARVQPAQTCRRVVSTLDIAPTVLDLAGLQPLASFQGVSFAATLSEPDQAIRQYAFAEHNWHDYRAFERAAFDEQFCYVRNWLANTPGTPPADAVRSPTYVVMQQMHQQSSLAPAHRGCFEVPRETEFLFDTRSDPHCINNLADVPDFAETRERMRTALSQWQQETGDAFPGEDALTPDGFDRTSGERIINSAHPSLSKK
jgi:N-sulfoglucosamine sulfohydrolase